MKPVIEFKKFPYVMIRIKIIIFNHKMRQAEIKSISDYQFRKIKFWLIPHKQPSDTTIPRNDVKTESQSAVHLEKFRKVGRL